MTKILMIDDDVILTRAVKKILEPEPYEFDSAEEGQAGLDKIKTTHPDLILLDVELPDMSGYNVCQIVKQDPALRPIPVLMLTGNYIEPDDKAMGLDIGADDYLLKPFDNEMLIVRIQTLLRRAQGR